MISLHLMQILTFVPSESLLNPALTALEHFWQIIIRFEISTELSLWTIPPCCWSLLFLRLCFFTILIPCTSAFIFFGKIVSTFPVLPLSLPASILTISFFFILDIRSSLRSGDYRNQFTET